jgi:Cu2+-exporting ATPase
MIKNEKYDVTGMSCAACVAHVNKAVEGVEGVKEVNVNLLTNSMVVSYEAPASPEMICKAVSDAGYGAKQAGAKDNASKGTKAASEDHETRVLMTRLILSLILLLPLFYFSLGYMNPSWNWPLGEFRDHPFAFALLGLSLSLAIMVVNKKFFISGVKSLVHGAPNMDTLVALGSGVGFIYGVVLTFIMAFYVSPSVNMESYEAIMRISMSLTFETAGMIPALITIGKTLESYSKGKTTNAIKSLLELAPKEANVIRDGKEIIIPIEQMVVGDTFIVRPGESFPADGIVVEGESAVNEAALTGESVPVDKSKGDKVSAATINLNGALTGQANKVGNDTVLHQIVEMVETAAGTKTKISLIADRVSAIFVPSIMIVALVVFAGWLIAGLALLLISSNL